MNPARTGTTTLPLHWGKAPAWLFSRMTRETGFFATGGKDGHPYPVARDVYDQSIEFLKEVVNKSKIQASDKQRAFKQLAAFYVRGDG